MTEIKEGTIGVVWMKEYPDPEMSIHRYEKRPEGYMTWMRAEGTYLKDNPAYNKLFPVLSLLQNPRIGAEAFYFTPEEYAAIMEGV